MGVSMGVGVWAAVAVAVAVAMAMGMQGQYCFFMAGISADWLRCHTATAFRTKPAVLSYH